MANYPTLDEFLLENLQEDPEFYEAYLEVSLEEFQEDNDTQALLKSLRRLAEAKGGIPRLAKQIGLSKQGLYKALSSDGSPKLSTVTKILQGLGYRLRANAQKSLSHFTYGFQINQFWSHSNH